MDEIEENKSKKTISLKRDYIISIKEILSASSLGYLLSPFRSKRLLIKIIWSFFLLLFCFGSIHYSILNILDYLKYETTTSIYTINEQEIEFPTVSFCLKTDYGSENIFEIDVLEMWFGNQNITTEWQNHIESYQILLFFYIYVNVNNSSF